MLISLSDFQSRFFQYLLRWETPLQKKMMAKFVSYLIPFNRSFGFKILHLHPHEVTIALPFQKALTNHVGSTHACAIATLGELTAGLVIILKLGGFTHRLIMSHLEVAYFKQGRTTLEATAILDPEEWSSKYEELQHNHQCFIEMEVPIYNTKKDLVAKVTTQWQLKDWDQVRSKIR